MGWLKKQLKGRSGRDVAGSQSEVGSFMSTNFHKLVMQHASGAEEEGKDEGSEALDQWVSSRVMNGCERSVSIVFCLTVILIAAGTISGSPAPRDHYHHR
tara:strand:- start:202 stop:501 length:300 start_codon:yes stop_codon:yes gene_type:complete